MSLNQWFEMGLGLGFAVVGVFLVLLSIFAVFSFAFWAVNEILNSIRKE